MFTRMRIMTLQHNSCGEISSGGSISSVYGRFTTNDNMNRHSVSFCLGMREATPPADSLISVAFAVHLPYNDTYVGQTMWLGATLEINTNQIWAGQIAVTVANVTTPPIMVHVVFHLAFSFSCHFIHSFRRLI